MLSSKNIILVHGAGLCGLEMLVLKKRLLNKGFNVFLFRYSYYFDGLDSNAHKLKKFIEMNNIQNGNFVCHSLGGIVALKFLVNNPSYQFSSIVNLATPHNGSKIVRGILKLPFGFLIVGKTLSEFHQDLFEFDHIKNLAVIAGTVNFILGYLFALPSPNDTVLSRRDVKPDHSNHYRAVTATHASILFSKKAFNLILEFIDNKSFIVKS
ncbi:hypothetical protein VB712_03175 [Spirulina sp. CCNP1310]|uniref:lipase family alpha/beta hydrolase n=1 Tax=Spirulina sp. CCNP1310 TaxID=3110249 RepID=UPI002B2197F3|nr:hypothetical protein [Spirulina sp. CCNP1310]MEA5418211.1 hypothetical protein [Spirulina sp. CCNP1310]